MRFLGFVYKNPTFAGDRRLSPAEVIFVYTFMDSYTNPRVYTNPKFDSYILFMDLYTEANSSCDQRGFVYIV